MYKDIDVYKLPRTYFLGIPALAKYQAAANGWSPSTCRVLRRACACPCCQKVFCSWMFTSYSSFTHVHPDIILSHHNWLEWIRFGLYHHTEIVHDHRVYTCKPIRSFRMIIIYIVHDHYTQVLCMITIQIVHDHYPHVNLSVRFTWSLYRFHMIIIHMYCTWSLYRLCMITVHM